MDYLFFFAAMFYVYILYSKKADRFYVGHSSDVQKRLIEHNNPQANLKYTAKFLPWELLMHIPISERRGDAMKVEKFIKKQKNRLFLQRLIIEKDNFEYFNNLINNILKK